MSLPDRLSNLLIRCSAIGIIAALCFVTGCVDVARYNSKDLTVLPCEQGDNRFFLPLEFDDQGRFVYVEQLDAIREGLRRVDDVYIFTHGWDKTTESAERDYGDLICRFRTHSTGASDGRNSIIIGIFWPSTEFPRWLNFWKIKNRADRIARTGFAGFMEVLEDISFENEKHFRLNFIGHSFGGRLVVHGLRDYITKPNSRTFRFLTKLEQLQIVLLNAAVGEYSLLPQNFNFFEDFSAYRKEWDPNRFMKEMQPENKGMPLRDKEMVDLSDVRLFWIPTLTELAAYTDLRLYNVMSTHDMADRYLYRFGSLMENGGPTCAIGACGLKQWEASIKVLSNGSLEKLPDLKKSVVWNVDASQVILAHSDIYKGRVDSFLWQLLSIPKPVISQDDIEINEEELQPKPVGWSISEAPYLYEMFRPRHIAAMASVNYGRRMGEKRKLEAMRFISLLDDLDSYLKQRNWALAEAKLHTLITINDCPPGWWWQQNIGSVTPGTFRNKHDLGVSRGMICGWPPLSYLLGVVMYNQGNCPEALDALRNYRDTECRCGTQNLVYIGTKKLDSIDLPIVEFIESACHKIPVRFHRPKKEYFQEDHN